MQHLWQGIVVLALSTFGMATGVLAIIETKLSCLL